MSTRKDPNLRHPVRCDRGECSHQRNRCPWEARFRDPDGRQRTRTFPLHADAKAFLTAANADVQRNEWVDPIAGRETFRAFAKHVEATRVNRRASTRARDASLMANRVLPYLGDHQLSAITRMDVRAWIAELQAARLAPTTVRKCFQLAAQVMDEAVEQKLISASPCRGKKVELPVDERPERPLVSPQQVAALAEAIEPRYRALVLTAALTGLRWGELAALRVERVDFLRRRIDVAETLVEVNGTLTVGRPKTPKSTGKVAFPPALAEILSEHVRCFPSAAGLVFTSEEGTPLRRSNFARRIWQPAAVAAGIGVYVTDPASKKKRYEGATFHALRHACASWLIHGGANPLEVAEQLRHTRVSTTLGTYGHLFDGTGERVAGLLEEAFAEGQRALDASPSGESVVRALPASS